MFRGLRRAPRHAVAQPTQIVVGDIPAEPADHHTPDELRHLLDHPDRIRDLSGAGDPELAAAYARARRAEGCPVIAWISGESEEALWPGLASVARALGAADPQDDSYLAAVRLKAQLESSADPAVLVITNPAEALIRPLLPTTGPAEVVLTTTSPTPDPALRETADRLTALFPTREHAARDRVRSAGLVASATRVWQRAVDNAGSLSPETVVACWKAAQAACVHLITTADLTLAVTVSERVAAQCDAVFGADHPNTLQSRHDVGAAYRGAGRVSGAVAAYETVAAQRERVLGADHPATLTTRRQLAWAYLSAGRISEAVELSERVLAAWERLGAERAERAEPAVARACVAASYLRADRLQEAQHMITAALAVPESELAADHPDRLAARLTRAVVVQLAGRPKEGGKQLESVVADLVRVEGSRHPDSLASRVDLAVTYLPAGRYEEARSRYEDVLADCERALGGDHPLTLSARHGLALAYLGTGQRRDALRLLREVLAARERTLGPDHFATRRSRSALADAQRAGVDMRAGSHR